MDYHAQRQRGSKVSELRYLCRDCRWEWRIHWWLPFDYELSVWAWKRHRRSHDRPIIKHRSER